MLGVELILAGEYLPLDASPTWRNDIGVGIAVPWVRGKDNLIRVWIEPCTPPGEAAVCDDVVAASGHQAQVFVRRIFGVVIHDDSAFEFR
jgi:hypothetical protein